MFFREINGADQSRRLTLAGNEGFLPTNHSLGPGSALEEKGEKNWSGQKKNIGEGSEPRGSLERGNGIFKMGRLLGWETKLMRL